MMTEKGHLHLKLSKAKNVFRILASRDFRRMRMWSSAIIDASAEIACSAVACCEPVRWASCVAARGVGCPMADRVRHSLLSWYEARPPGPLVSSVSLSKLCRRLKQTDLLTLR